MEMYTGIKTEGRGSVRRKRPVISKSAEFKKSPSRGRVRDGFVNSRKLRNVEPLL
jgi:hypothetical protein